MWPELCASYEKAIQTTKRGREVLSEHVNLSAFYNRKVIRKRRSLVHARAAQELDPKSDGAWFQTGKSYGAQGRLK